MESMTMRYHQEGSLVADWNRASEKVTVKGTHNGMVIFSEWLWIKYPNTAELKKFIKLATS